MQRGGAYEKSDVHKTAFAEKEFLFRDAPIWNAVFSMALPTIFSMLVMVFYNMADMFFIGQMGDSAQVAAVSLTGPVFNILMAIGSMLGGGSCALIAQTLGSRDGELVKLYSSLTCWGSLLFGGLFSAVLLFGCTPILGFLGANGEIWPSAKIYLSVLAWGRLSWCSPLRLEILSAQKAR